jgi:hypothetical protein
MRDLHERQGGVVALVASSAAVSVAMAVRTLVLKCNCCSVSATGAPKATVLSLLLVVHFMK